MQCKSFESGLQVQKLASRSIGLKLLSKGGGSDVVGDITLRSFVENYLSFSPCF